MIYTPSESQRQELSFWGSNSGNPFSRNYTNPTTISWSDRTLSRAEFLYTVKATVPICIVQNPMRQELSFWDWNSGNPFSRNYTNPTTISWSDRTLS